MSATLLLVLTAMRLGTIHHHYTGNEVYYELPRFWTSTGFCPAGDIGHKDITRALLSDALQMQLRHIAALPTGALTHIRIHWLLELIQFVQYTQAGVPIYDFGDLDAFLMNLDELGLLPVIEFMANPGDVFVNNPTRNDFLWEDFSYQVTKHYLNLFGARKILSWRFETWNEPDVVNYNRLNFTSKDYLTYTGAVRRGLNAAGRRPVNSLYFQLRGPAGLFRALDKHPLCWHLLEQCNANLKQCPFEILTYHRKGNGTNPTALMAETSLLLKEIYEKYPNLKALPISNDEADPIVGWSTPRAFHEDVNYAASLVSIVLLHWQAKLELQEFKQLESLSHDNAFLSYHPHEFSQRTLLAHFRMNNTLQADSIEASYSQFIQKPVYAALGFLSKLAPYAAPLENVNATNDTQMWLLKTTSADDTPLYLSWIMLPNMATVSNDNLDSFENFTFQRHLPFELCKDETYAYIIETLIQHETDPAYIWHSYGSPPYPNAALRELMRRHQTPKLHSTDLLKSPEIEFSFEDIATPWIVLVRVCSNLFSSLKKPQGLVAERVTSAEVLLTWREIINSTQCLKTYEVWFQNDTSNDWNFISRGWHLPFPSFQYAPKNVGVVSGFYKVRGIDIFNAYSPFSEAVEYFEI